MTLKMNENYIKDSIVEDAEFPYVPNDFEEKSNKFWTCVLISLI